MSSPTPAERRRAKRHHCGVPGHFVQCSQNAELLGMMFPIQNLEKPYKTLVASLILEVDIAHPRNLNENRNETKMKLNELKIRKQ